MTSPVRSKLLTIYRNGMPFEKPLRISLRHNEFRDINNLLDYINTRLVIPGGARYLFTGDGCVIYSLNELQHGAPYIVSGTRYFESQSNYLIHHSFDASSTSGAPHSSALAHRTPPATPTHSTPIHTPAHTPTRKPRMRHKQQAEDAADTPIRCEHNRQPNIKRGTKSPSHCTNKERAQVSSIPRRLPSDMRRRTASTPTSGFFEQDIARGKSETSETDTTHSKTNIVIIDYREPRRIARAPLDQLSPLLSGNIDQLFSWLAERIGMQRVDRLFTDDLRRVLNVEQFERELETCDNFLVDGVLPSPVHQPVRIDRSHFQSINDDHMTDDRIYVNQNLTIDKYIDEDKLSSGKRQERRTPSPIELAKYEVRPDRSELLRRSMPTNLVRKKSVKSTQAQVKLAPASSNISNKRQISNRIISRTKSAPHIEVRVRASRAPLPVNGRPSQVPHAGKIRSGQEVTAINTSDFASTSKDKSRRNVQKTTTKTTTTISGGSRRRPTIRRSVSETSRRVVTFEDEVMTRQTTPIDSTVLVDLPLSVTPSTCLIGEPSPTSNEMEQMHELANIPAILPVVDIKIHESITPPIESPDDVYPYGTRQDVSAQEETRNVNQNVPDQHVTSSTTRESRVELEKLINEATGRPVTHNGGESASEQDSMKAAIDSSGSIPIHELKLQSTDQQIDLPDTSQRQTRRAIKCAGAVAHLRSGSQVPKRGFKLAWINGFTINDDRHHRLQSYFIYDALLSGTESAEATDSTTNGSNEQASDDDKDDNDPSKLEQQKQRNKQRSQHPLSYLTLQQRQQLTRAKSSPKNQAGDQASEFEPSERYMNSWLHYVDGELVYPVGAFIVLWNRTHNSQRYYCGHTASISCVTIGHSSSIDGQTSQDDNDTGKRLAASAQIEDALNRRPRVHVWSVETLETMHVLDERVFSGTELFSVSLSRNEEHVLVAARDTRHLWLHVCELRLNESKTRPQATNGSSRTGINKKQNIRKDDSGFDRRLVARAKKVLTRNERVFYAAFHPYDERHVLTFGRRHLTLWLIDRKHAKLVSISVVNQSNLTQLANANCLSVQARNTYLIGDQSGQLSVWLQSDTAKRASISGPSSATNSTGSGVGSSALATASAVASVEAATMVGSGASTSSVTFKTSVRLTAGHENAPITSLLCVGTRLLVTGDARGTIKTWSSSSGESTMDQNTGPDQAIDRYECINAVRLPPELGAVCALKWAFGVDEFAKIYVATSTNVLLVGPVFRGHTYAVVYEGHEMAVRGLGALPSNPKSSSSRHKKEQHTNNISTTDFSCSLDRTICRWNSRRLVWKSLIPSECTVLAVHISGRALAVGTTDGTVYILSAHNGNLASFIPLTPISIGSLVYSSDGALLACGCANGSVFLLPVQNDGFVYSKVSIFQSPHPVLSLQFSADNMYLLSAVKSGDSQQLILWDLANFRYIKAHTCIPGYQNIEWHDPTCSASEDVRAIWDNANLSKSLKGRIVNLACTRSPDHQCILTGDAHGFVRLFSYPCSARDAAFYEIRCASFPVAGIKCLPDVTDVTNDLVVHFVSSGLDGSLYLWSQTND